MELRVTLPVVGNEEELIVTFTALPSDMRRIKLSSVSWQVPPGTRNALERSGITR